MFFMLSGFVLTLPALGGKAQPYLAYAVRRICRIYLPYLGSLGLALSGCWLFHGRNMYGHEFRLTWHSAPELYLTVQHLAFLGRYNAFAYNPVIWSLVHELRISLIFPLLCWISLRLRAWVALCVALSLPVVAALPRIIQHVHAAPTDMGSESVSWLRTLGYCGIFLLGSILARYAGPLSSRVPSWPQAVSAILFVIALALYHFPGRLHVPWPIQDLATGAGAAYAIVLALNKGGRMSRFLQHRVLIFCGRISYSLYLLQVPILLVLSILFYARFAYGYLLLPFLGIALIASAMFYRFVEEPSIHLGRFLGQQIGRRLAKRALLPASGAESSAA
jgi:peptidoglycan/LPS O-acetylase OafA/YrhL